MRQRSSFDIAKLSVSFRFQTEVSRLGRFSLGDNKVRIVLRIQSYSFPAMTITAIRAVSSDSTVSRLKQARKQASKQLTCRGLSLLWRLIIVAGSNHDLPKDSSPSPINFLVDYLSFSPCYERRSKRQHQSTYSNTSLVRSGKRNIEQHRSSNPQA
jgi:hypothetical protein